MNLKDDKQKIIKRIVFSDVDGTIYGFPGKVLEEETRLKINKYIEKYKIEFVLNTGNPPMPKIQRLAQKLGARYIVCANGAGVYDLEQKKYIYAHNIQKYTNEKIFKLALKHKLALYYWSTSKYYLYNSKLEDTIFLENWCEFWDFDKSGFIPDEINKIEIAGKEEDIARAYQDLIKSNLDITPIKFKKHIEITAKNVNKGEGMLYLCDHVFNADHNYVMAIGDSANDIPMLKIAGFSYAMDNSPKEVKSLVRYFTSDVFQFGLVEAIEDYVFRTKLDIEKQDLITKIVNQKQKNHY